METTSPKSFKIGLNKALEIMLKGTILHWQEYGQDDLIDPVSKSWDPDPVFVTLSLLKLNFHSRYWELILTQGKNNQELQDLCVELWIKLNLLHNNYEVWGQN